jgi:hypothetical protein
MSYYENRADLADAISKLAPFIQQRTKLPLLTCQRLAMDILSDSEASGVVSLARAARLIEGIDQEDS